jgi:cysteine desulfurase
VSIARAEAERVLLTLGERFALSSGAACAEAGGQGSHVLRALGLGDDRIYTALRFGLGRYNVEAEVDVVVAAVAEAADAVRARSAPLPR